MGLDSPRPTLAPDTGQFGWSVVTGGAGLAEVPGLAERTLRLRLLATRLSMRGLVILILTAVLAGGVLAAGFLTLLGPDSAFSGRAGIIITSGLLGILLSLILLFSIRARRRVVTLDFGSAGVRVASPGRTTELPWESIARLVYRRGTDYARVSLSGRGVAVTLMPAVGMPAEESQGTALPEMPQDVLELFQNKGFSQQQVGESQRSNPGLEVFRR